VYVVCVCLMLIPHETVYYNNVFVFLKFYMYEVPQESLCGITQQV
jgi:hypothetical protein